MGRLDALDGTFTRYSNTGVVTDDSATVNYWNDPSNVSLDNPLLWNNVSASEYRVGTLEWLPGWAGFHPGADTLSAYRFTAPLTGTFSIIADFQGADVVGASTSVFVHKVDSVLYSAYISGNGERSRESWSGSTALTMGDHLDFVVSNGGNGQSYDSTAIRAVVMAPIPEPSVYALMLGGLALISSMTRRKT